MTDQAVRRFVHRDVSGFDAIAVANRPPGRQAYD
jgi:hypothetical protein